jgi:hypothetical protein
MPPRIRRLLATGVATIVAAGCTPAEPAATTSPAPTTSVATATTTATPATAPTSTPPPQRHPVRIETGGFVSRATGEPFVVRGTNYFEIVPTAQGLQDRFFSPAGFDRETVEADFERLQQAGYNTVRLFLDSCNGGPDCIGNPTGTGLNGAYLDVVAQVMDLAATTGMMLLLTSNDLPDQGGYWQISDRDNAGVFPGYRNSHYLTPSGTEAAVTYWTDLLDGLVERNARFDAVLGWSILNEQWMFTDQYPLNLATGVVTTKTGDYDMGDPAQRRAMVVDNVRAYLAAVAAVIKAHDPNGLVTMGFFAPQFPNPTTIGGDWYVDTAPLVADSALDFFDFHVYLGTDLTIGQIAENFGVTDAKPVIMGEVGAFVDQYPDPTGLGWRLQQFIADSCNVGFDGWLQWGYLRAPEAIGDATWALTDNDGALLRDLSPASWPDPCTPNLHNPNLAAGAAVTASQSLAEEPASNAVDGSPAQWGSGGDAPQWIEIDLGATTPVAEIRLTVAQWPGGTTVHRIRWAGDDHSFAAGPATLEGETEDGDVIGHRWDPPVPMRYIRIETVSSPSWVSWHEVEVLGTPAS